MTVAPLILVVGPSGAGKDALLGGARARLAGEARYHFAQRMVTRPASAGAEDHISLSEAEFQAVEADHGFLLSWRAHGLGYGIPRAVESFRRAGCAVVANVSRTVVDEAREALGPVGIVVVTAPPKVLAARLARRGRETAPDIEARLTRAAEPFPSGADVALVSNDAGLEEGVGRFVAALRSFFPDDRPMRVTAVSRHGLHAFSKDPQTGITLIAGLGVEGDAHAGTTVRHRSRVARDPTQPNLRQVHLIHSELFEELADKGFALAAGQMGENVTTRGVDLLALPSGTRLHLGAEAVVEITGLRNPCAQIDDFRPGLLRAVLDRDAAGRLIRKAGVMGIVLRGGEVRPDDAIRVELPPLPHTPLDRV